MDTRPGAEPNRDLKFTAKVAISEPGIIDGVPILDVLVHMAKVVGDIVAGFAPCLA